MVASDNGFVTIVEKLLARADIDISLQDEVRMTVFYLFIYNFRICGHWAFIKCVKDCYIHH